MVRSARAAGAPAAWLEIEMEVPMTVEVPRTTRTRASYFRVPTLVTYGFGVAERIGDEVRRLGASRVMIVTDPGVIGAGLLDGVERSLGATDVTYTVFSDVEPDPSVETAERTLAALRESDAEVVVGVGGGSPMDAAKAGALLATNGGSIGDYEGMDKIAKPGLPVICIPTTGGTGSEVTLFTVITDLKRNFKMSIGGVNIAPHAALVDPLLTVSMPPALTAATGMDSLTHAVESFVNKASYEVSDALAGKAIALVAANLRTVYRDGSNLAARDAMMMSAMLGAMAFVNTRLGNVHAMAHAVGAYYGVPHGVANAVLLPYVMEYNAVAVPAKFARVARLMGESVDGFTDSEAAAVAVAAVRRLNADVGIPARLRQLGVKADSIPMMAADAMKSGNIPINPRSTTLEEMVQLFEQAL